MQLPTHEDASVEVALGRIAEHLIFSHDLLEKLIDLVKILVRSRLMPVDFILHLCPSCRQGNATLNEEEVRSMEELVSIDVLCKWKNCLPYRRRCVGVVERAEDLKTFSLICVPMLDVPAGRLDPVSREI